MEDVLKQGEKNQVVLEHSFIRKKIVFFTEHLQTEGVAFIFFSSGVPYFIA